jgi:glycosyltransferase involved in cell wall biosynthesis
MPRVSIGMPVHNGERFIRSAIESLLAQTYGDFELVISDNASTDATEAICRDYQARDARVRYSRSERNLGGPANFRRVFHLCSGELHKWATADDYWEPTFVERCVGILDARPDIVLAYSKSLLEDGSGNLIRRYEDHLHLVSESPSARFIQVVETARLGHGHLGVGRRAVFLKTGLIGSELASDLRFLAELSLYGKFFVVDEYLFHRRFHEASSSWDRNDMEWQRAYYDPEHRTVFGFHTWRRYAHLLAAVLKAPISAREKQTVGRYLARKATRQRGQFLDDLRLFARRDQPSGAAIVHEPEQVIGPGK